MTNARRVIRALYQITNDDYPITFKYTEAIDCGQKKYVKKEFRKLLGKTITIDGIEP